MDTTHLSLSIITDADYHALHFDARITFLYGEAQRSLFMRQPQCYETGSNSVCKLNKCINGLKQDRRWNTTFIKFMKLFKLTPPIKDECVVVRNDNDTELIIAIYVDDAMASSNSKQLLLDVTQHLKSKFEISVTVTKRFVGFNIIPDRSNMKT